MRLFFNSSRPALLRETLHKALNCKIIDIPYKTELEINDKSLKGKVVGYEFKQAGLIYYSFDLEPVKNVTFVFGEGMKQLFHLIFCAEGRLDYDANSTKSPLDLGPVMEVMISTPKADRHELHLNENNLLTFHLIQFDKRKFWENRDKFALKALPEDLAETLQGKQSEFLYQTNYNIAAAQYFTEIRESKYEGIIKRIFVESKLLEMIAFSFNQYKREQTSTGRRVSMKQKDIELLIEARKILHARLKDPPTIRQLAKLAGINENKLKHGFKELFNETVNESLTNHRLGVGKILLVQHELNIREIAAEIGYQNAGYFSKLFKKKFGVKPRDFVKSITLEFQ